MDTERTVGRLAILNADVSGSTRLYERCGDAIAQADIAHCLECLTAVAEARGGRRLETLGDEVVCGFPLPDAALEAAFAMHAALRTASAAGAFHSGTLRVKVGWHYGQPEWLDGAFTGAARLVARQVIALARPEEVLASGAAVAALSPAARATAQLIDTVPSCVDGTPLEVYRLPWEDDSEVTQFRAAAAPSPPPAQHRLELRLGTQRQVVDAANPCCRIGRVDGNDVVIDSPYTSREHARIVFRNGRFLLEDRSVNGTFITPVGGPRSQLHRDDALLDGSGTLEFGVPAAVDAAVLAHYSCE